MMEKESLAAEIGELSSELAKYKGENFDYKVYTIFVKFSNTFVYNRYMHCFTCLYTNPLPPLQKIPCPDHIPPPPWLNLR